MSGRKLVSALSAEQVERINQLLRTGKRVELIPVRKGVRIVEVRRTNVDLKTEG